MKTLVAEVQRALAAMHRKDVPSFRLVRRDWSKQLKNSPGTSIIALAKLLVPLGFWERIFAYEIIVHHQPALNALPKGCYLARSRYEKLGRSGLLCLLRCRPGLASAK